ncbi:hypothetical protein [Azospirillum sp. TSO5]|uniref:hypothetical protein n=1 Tax=Azospirillum sp. TSO5 TaxID=716760 RepID=UPI000D61DDAA|nr:hypothetical protein [Azospirillum sp. TSO5]PWC96917.1 hypothetical protein TSO5_05635 [Azospirillum sp. TSO5]
MNMISPIRQPEMPAIEVFERMAAAAKRMGDAIGIDGYFRLAYEVHKNGAVDASIHHWYKPDQYAFPKCVTACADGSYQNGSLANALDELDRYVDEHATIPAIAAE